MVMKISVRISCFLLIFLLISPSYADIYLKNNYEKIGGDISFGYDRYGRTKKSSSGGSDSFSYFLRSLVIPGWGEYKLGYKDQAARFLITDILLIGTAFGLNYYSGLRTDEYKDYAVMYAGITSSGKSDSYWVHISNYDNTLEYNEQKNVRRYFTERYEDDDDFWSWESADRRKKYDDIRISAENAGTWFYYSLGGIALNHFLSALNASGKASRIKAGVKQTLNERGQIRNQLNLTYSF